MQIENEKKAGLLGIGEVAERYNISARTLRLYHKLNLIVPNYVDEQTGYRFYSEEQFPRLEIVLQMKEAGVKLKQIEHMLKTQDVTFYESVLGQQLDQIQEEIKDIKFKRDMLRNQLENLKQISQPLPEFGTVFTEYIPKRTVFLYMMQKPYEMGCQFQGKSPWQDALDEIKKIFKEREVPNGLLHQVSGYIPQQSLNNPPGVCGGAWIEIKKKYRDILDLTIFPANIYLCMYQKYTAMDNVEEWRGVSYLLDQVQKRGYQIAGPCLTQVIAESSVFDYSSHDVYIKHQIPITF